MWTGADSARQYLDGNTIQARCSSWRRFQAAAAWTSHAHGAKPSSFCCCLKRVNLVVCLGVNACGRDEWLRAAAAAARAEPFSSSKEVRVG
ncbi:uncharacterized protein A4U43_C09F7590 [Asparagus officinalis]|uniref:Uncharacterized protein n=1 Tax=Asparagus officinalis TaxID=4686 RepID=A0A5P1E5Z2_ASPOF|nr:uncharacterized protein A4U43_C09F7590 [Asparagus officinalis]